MNFRIEKNIEKVFGYARVSTHDQNLNLQLDALEKAGVDEVFEEKASGGKQKRPQLEKLKECLREGDQVVVWRLDRLGRSLNHLVELMTFFKENKIEFKSINESIDTSTPTGTLIFHIFAALAEFERSLIMERTKAGLAGPKSRGLKPGRKKGLSQSAKIKAAAAKSLYLKERDQISVEQIAKELNISKTTLYKYLRLEGVNISEYKKPK